MPAPNQTAAIAAAAGGTATRSQRIAGAPVVALAFCDGWQAARALGALAAHDAHDPQIRRIAAIACDAIPQPRRRAEVLLHFVQAHIAFAREPVETFQSAAVTLQRRAGDCDDSARLLYALARAAGIPARLAFLAAEGQPVHVFAELWTGRCYEPAETTIRGARLGEDPRAAAHRLGIRMRRDLAPGPALATIGAVQDLATTAQTWTIPAGPISVRVALDAPALQSDADLAVGLQAIGLSDVRILDPRTARAGEWPGDWINMRPTDSAHVIRLAWGRYAGAQRTLTRDVSDPSYSVRTAQATDDATPPTTGAPMQTADLPPVPAMPPPSEPRSAWARIVVAHAWRDLYSDRPLTEQAADLVVAVASLETQLLRASQGNFNWGNLHGGKVDCAGSCPPGSTMGHDRDGAGNKYCTCFRSYPDAVAGMRDYLRTLTRGAALAALQTGDPAALAAAMKANGYYEASVSEYTRALSENLAIVRKNLDAARNAAGLSWYVLPMIALAVGIAAIAATKG